MNTNNGVKWRRFIVPKKLNKLMTTYYLLRSYTYLLTSASLNFLSQHRVSYTPASRGLLFEAHLSQITSLLISGLSIQTLRLNQIAKLVY